MIADGPVRAVLPQLPVAPPLLQLAQALDWQPMPLTVKEARPFAPALVGGAAVLPPTPTVTAAPPAAPSVLAVSGLRFSAHGHQTLKDINFSI